jgi:3-deoxy-manno-octulosonate cytidylyltransferase (CMP-KDO synthetase)
MSARFRIAIPARYGSTRFPGKPLIEIAGRSLLEHVWRRALGAGADQVVVATEDRRIAEAADGFGAQVCMTHADHASGTDRLAEVAAHLQWSDDDIVVNLQGDEPLTPPSLLAQVAGDLADSPEAAVATLATPLEPAAAEDPNVVKVVTDARGYALYFSRAPIPWWRDGRPHDPDPPFRRHLGLYAYRAGFLRAYAALAPAPLERAEQLEQLRVLWHGHAIHVAEASGIPGAGVDTPEDVARVEAALRESGRAGGA